MGAIDLDNLTKEKLAAELRTLVTEAEDMLRAVAKHGGEQLDDVREKFEQRVKLARVELEKAELAIMARAKEAARSADRYVHDNPWKAAGMAGGLGLIIGLLIGRK